MAKIITKPSELTNEFLMLIKRVKRSVLCAVIFVITSVIGSVVMNNGRLFSAGLIILGISALGFITSLFTAIFRYNDATVIRTGIDGEKNTARIVSSLPDNYFGIQNAVIKFDGKLSELDMVVIGPTGIFIVETKNRKGFITGKYDSQKWTQTKTGRTGNEYSNDFYSPIKQISTHIFRLAHFLKQNGVKHHIEGIVYFSGADKVDISGREGEIAIITTEKALKKHIVSKDTILDDDKISQILNILA